MEANWQGGFSIEVTEYDEPVAQSALARLAGGGAAALYTVTVAGQLPEREKYEELRKKIIIRESVFPAQLQIDP